MKNQKGVSLITLIITIIVVIILAVIVLRSGASDTPDQAAFSGFTTEMGDLQDNMTAAMLDAKGDEALKGNQRSEAQLYNFIARGGEKVVSGETDWLLQSDADAIPCTLINRDEAEDILGDKLPVRKVETAKGTNQQVSYFVTSEGIVFCWPPYVYDGKSYVNAEDYVEIGKVNASSGEISIPVGSKTININNNDGATAANFTPNYKVEDATKSVWYPGDTREGEVATGFTFNGYNNGVGVSGD